MKGSGSYSSTAQHHSGSTHGQMEEMHVHSHHHTPQGGHPHGQISKPPSTHQGSSPHFNFSSDTDRSDLDSDEYMEDEDEIYLKPGEPYGACLMPVEDPYIRAIRVEEANRELFSVPLRRRKTTMKVRIGEERNQYYDIDDPYDYNLPDSESEIVEGSHGGGRQVPLRPSNPSYESGARRLSPNRGISPR